LARRFVPVLFVFPCVVIISLLLTLGAMEILSAARAFEIGAGLWPKAQRDAAYSLTLYARTRDPTYFERYQQALAIPLSDYQALLEIDKPDYDYTTVYDGLKAGGIHADDIPGMVRLYRCCANYSYFKHAVSIWKQGDRYIAQIQRLGSNLHAEISSGAPSAKRIESILNRIRAVDARANLLESAVTDALGEAVQRLRAALILVVSVVISVLAVLGINLTARVMVRMHHVEEDYRLLASAIAHAANGIMILDTERRILTVNNAFTTITGYAPDEVVGHLLTRPQTRKIPGPTLYSIWADVRTSGRWEGEVWNVRKNGELYTMRLSLCVVPDDRQSEVSYYVAVFNDISPHKINEERLNYLATHDPLTGLPNRTEFERCCREAMARARRQGHRLAVLYIDLDNFKPVNDTYGHEAGDELLRVLGTRIQQMMRETDIVARIGGDEFSVLLTDLDDVSRSYIVACKLIDMLSQPAKSRRGTHTVGASIGISTYPDDGNDPQTLLRLADAAMYRVKQGRRSGVSFYSAPSGSPIPSATPTSLRKR